MTKQELNQLVAKAAVSATAVQAFVEVAAMIRIKNNDDAKVVRAKNIDFSGFDWTGVTVPAYTLPVATDKVLGGVKIGANVTKAADGTISVSGGNVKDALGYTPANSTDVTTLQGYFTDGKANEAANADQLGGKNAADYALKTDVNNALNNLDWKNSVADAVALKAIAAPQEAWTVSLADTNAIYRFDAQGTQTADATGDDAGEWYVPTDKTAGAWLKIGTAKYSPATAQADGLMSKADKAKLDNFADADQYATKTNLDTKVDKVNGKGLSTNDFTNDYKAKLDGLQKVASIVFANIDIGSNTAVNLTDLNIPAGYIVDTSTTIIDNQGGKYNITKVNDDGKTVQAGPVGLQLALKSAVDGKVDKVAGKGLSTNDYDAAAKGKVDGLANIKSVGAGLALNADTGELTATAQALDFVSDDFINGLFA